MPASVTKSTETAASQQPLPDKQAQELRRLVAEISDSVEARIRNEDGAAEKVRRATQTLQIAGMGQFPYWETLIMQPLKNVCLVMAMELGILTTISKHDGSITAAEVAKKIGSDEMLVARIMRVLTCVGIGEETGPDTYRENELSKIAASPGGQAGVKIWNETLFPVASRLIPYMREHGFKQFPKRPQEMDPTEFTHGKMMFDHFKVDPELKQWFDTLMVTNSASAKPWYTIYPFAEQLGDSCSDPNQVLLVDVGGNLGADLTALHHDHPDMTGRLILQDLPETIARIDTATTPEKIETQTYDFFTPQPVKGAKAYFWRWVLESFNDDMVRDFLTNTVKAMDKDSRVLIEEMVLPDVGADFKGSHSDILMMLFHSGMERTSRRWTSLLDSCGLRIVKIWKRVDAEPSVLECVPK